MVCSDKGILTLFKGVHVDVHLRPQYAMHSPEDSFWHSFAFVWQQFGTLTATKRCTDCKGGAGREGGRRVSDGLATGERRVMLAMYLRVNHWVDFDESDSGEHLE